MADMEQVSYKVAKLRRTLLIIILATIPCYLLGIFILWVANSSRSTQTPTPTINAIFITATNPATATNMPPTKYPSKTPTATATVTDTPTETKIPTATSTPTELPTDTPIPPTDTTIPPTEVPPTDIPVVVDTTAAP